MYYALSILQSPATTIKIGCSPTVKDRVYASIMGAKAVELIAEGKKNRVVGYKNGEYIDFDINEALQMRKEIPEEQMKIAADLAL